MAGEEKKRYQRFRVRRRVPVDQFKTREQRELEEMEKLPEVEKGPLDDGGLKGGCYGCLSVMVLFFVIMIASIIATCIIPNDWSLIGR